MDRIETPWPGTGPGTVTAMLRQHAERTPDALAYRFLTSGGEESWSYRELDRRARTVAAYLQRENLQGRPVLLLHPPGLEYVANFLGCLYAGAIAVPAYPPDTGRFRQTLPRLAAIARDARATHALTTENLSRFADARHAEIAELGLGELRWLATDGFEAVAEEWRDPGTTGGTLAFLQYTSGSTSTPKGVMVSNDNLVANLRAIHHRLEHDRDSVMVSWLPPYHDMGLIGGILTPLYGGFPAHLMAPMTFVQRPLLWLETISTTRASTAIAPNFGFDYCLRRITPEQRDGLDLRHWRLALNGAEPVRADTLERFADYFAPSGFDRRALSPCYGLAEATLIVTGVRAHDRTSVESLAAGDLEAGSVRPAGEGERSTRVVGCGPAADSVGVAIVDPRTGRRVGDGRVGEIWVTGPSVARGYWRRPEETRESFHARLDGEGDTRYLRTGDLGFERNGELYVAGRTKDVIIVQGRNHYPQDVELTVEKAGDVIRANNGAAFGILVDGAEELVVAYEVEGRLLDDADGLLARLRTAIAEEHEVSPHAVVLLKRSAVRKTTSGKIQRQACKEAFLRFELPVVAASVVREFGEPGPARTPSRTDVAVAVEELLGGAGGFTDLGLDHAGLLTAVRTLEHRFGARVPIGPLLADPRTDTLVTLLAGEGTGDAAPSAERSATEIEAWLAARIADRLGLHVDAVEVTRPFATIGLDSKKAVAILEELGGWLGRELTPGVLFDHPTVRDVAANLAGRRTEPTAPTEITGGEEPIAVVGLGCRFPGAPDVESYWRLLLDGRDAISEVPPDRWDPEGVNAPRFGGFVDHVREFDARFFGISAREAERMDPQQRVLLEVAWRTFEDAGIAPDRVAGTDTGVFVGISSHDYSELQLGDLDAIDVHAATGNAHSVAANRLSYLFDMSGPSLAIDTACSSSLAAIHLACRSLRAGECRMALAGGVNLLLTPALSVAFSNGRMLAEDGRCRTFDDAASGYVRGEGAGLACLKPLSVALADGDRIYAVVTGSGVGHGGRSNGLTAPKGSAQRAVIERALGQAGLRGDQIDYVEAHGTGTSLGDPIEWEALAGVYGRSRPEDAPCLVGSVKTNIGHLEAAAGIAGFIKAALVVRHRQVPPQLHLRTPNRHLDWDGSGLEVPVRGRELPPRDVTRAGVSSFGFGGTNAHVVLETAPAPDPAPSSATAAPERPSHALCLSGHTPTALMTLARHYRSHLAAHTDVPLGDLCHAANVGRARLAHRAVLVAGSAEDLDTSLDALVRGEPARATLRGHVSGRSAPKPAFLFSGQGTQYAGMGKAIYQAHPGFARTIERGDAVLRPLLGVSLLDLLFDEDGADRLRRTRYCQPALVAFEVALAELWMSLGVRPAAVLGHSVGAFSAACVAGVLSLEDALTLAATRGESMDAQPGDGAMIACAGNAETIRAVAESASVTIAAINTPEHLVLSGPGARIQAAREELEGRGVVVRPLAVSHAFHSESMAGAAGPLREAAGAVAFGPPDLPWISDATGEPVEHVDAGYWVDHMLGTVRFADGFATARRLGCDAFVEIGPHPTLLNLARAMTPEGDAPLWLPSLRRGGRDWETFLQSLGRLHCAGGDVDWSALDAGHSRARVTVPSSVFERQPYWFAAGGDEARAMDTNGGQRMEIGVNSNGSHPAGAAAHNGVSPNGHGTPGNGAIATGPSAEVLPHVVGQVSKVCGFPVDQIPADAHVGTDLGLDSLMKAELERLLAARYPDRVAGLRERLSEDFTVGELAAALDGGGAPAGPWPTPPTPPTPPQQAQQNPHPPAYGQPMPYPPPQAYGPMGYWPPQPYAPGPQPMPYAPVPYAHPPYAEQPPPPPAQAAPAEAAKPPVKRELEFEGWEEHAELQGRIRQIESSGANAYGRVHEGFNSARISMDGRAVINFSAFNYLALSAHPRLRAAAKAAIDRYGTSSSATPLLCGETPLHHELDAEIADFLGTEAAIVFAGGHATNVATVGHLFGPEDLILHDEWIHDSTVRGCILSGAKRRPFPHNDWNALDKVLTAMRDQYRRAVIVIEGAYSQDGDIPDLPKFIEVKKRHDAMLMIDEAHSIGVLGRTGPRHRRALGRRPPRRGPVDGHAQQGARQPRRLHRRAAADHPVPQVHRAPVHLQHRHLTGQHGRGAGGVPRHPGRAGTGREGAGAVGLLPRGGPRPRPRHGRLARHRGHPDHPRQLGTGHDGLERAAGPGRERDADRLPGRRAGQVPAPLLHQRRPPRRRPRTLPRPPGARHGHHTEAAERRDRSQQHAATRPYVTSARRSGRTRGGGQRIHRRPPDPPAGRARAQRPRAGPRGQRPLGLRRPAGRGRGRLAEQRRWPAPRDRRRTARLQLHRQVRRLGCVDGVRAGQRARQPEPRRGRRARGRRRAVPACEHHRRLRLPGQALRRERGAERHRPSVQPQQGARRARGDESRRAGGPATDHRAAGVGLRAAQQGLRHRDRQPAPGQADGLRPQGPRPGRAAVRHQRGRRDDRRLHVRLGGRPGVQPAGPGADHLA